MWDEVWVLWFGEIGDEERVLWSIIGAESDKGPNIFLYDSNGLILLEILISFGFRLLGFIEKLMFFVGLKGPKLRHSYNRSNEGYC